MRTFLAIALLAVGITVGAAVPGVSAFVQRTLTAAGVPATYLTPAAGPTPAKPDGDAAQEAKEAQEPAGHSHDHAGHVHGKVETEGKGGPRHEGHAHGKEEAEEGVIKMRPEQISGQGVTTTTVAGGTLKRHLLVPGTITLNTDQIARVPARVVGIVAEMRKRLGEEVAKGEVVAVLDSREVADAKSDFLTASVKAELEKTNFERQQALWDKRISAEAQFLQAQATYSEARLRVDLARQKLSALGLNSAEVASAAKRDETTPNSSTLRRYELRSPLTGRIVERKVDVGTDVGGDGDPDDLYTVADLSSVWIELAVPRTELAKIKESARVVLVPTQEDGNRRAEGKVIFVSPILNADTRSARVIVALPNPDMTWRPGTFVTTELEIARDTVAVRVPKAAVQTIEGKRVVFVRTDEGFEKREVALSRADDEAYEVTAGLKPGEEIALGNTFLLKAELGKSEADHDH